MKSFRCLLGFLALVLSVAVCAHADLPNVPYYPYGKGRKILIDSKSAQNTNWYTVIKDSEPQIAIKEGKVWGVRLRNIKESSPLKLMDLRSGDVITSINDVLLTETFQIPFVILRGLGWSKLQVGFKRGGAYHTVFIDSTFPSDNVFSAPDGDSNLGIGDAAAIIARAGAPINTARGLISDEILASVASKIVQVGSLRIKVLTADITEALR